MNNFINIKQYGFSEMFSKEIPQDSPLEPARVLSQEKGFYRIITDKGEKLAEVSGKFRYQATFSSISNDSFIRLPCYWRFCTGKLE